jgi:hypothetical protein
MTGACPQRIVPPIIAGEPFDLAFFRSTEDAALYFEPPDVRDGSLVAYDAEGRRLRFGVETGVRPGGFLWWRWTTKIEHVTLSPDTAAVARPDELATLLRGWLARMRPPVAVADGTPLPQLLDRAVERCGWTR